AAARAGLLSALTPGRTTAFTPVETETVTERPARRSRRLRLSEIVLGGALVATVALLATVLLTGTGISPNPAAHSRTPVTTSHTGHSPTQSATPSPPGGKLPPVAKAAAAFVGDLQAGVQSGQVTTQAGQNLFNQLQQLLFQTPGEDPQRVQQQYSQLVQAYDQYIQRGDITGTAASILSHALDVLRTAVGAH
ncbi:MAG: DUF1631 domain-containing protein, partial [Nocardiopsaceae bacterium]|nr:DUF1631 domain-containing protein [Nocardiopsaceae bacterium]